MKIENVSKKIIGNADFRLLPGETMDVTGYELWVKRGLGKGALKTVEETSSDASDGVSAASETTAEDLSTNVAEAASGAAEGVVEGAAEEATTTTRKSKSKKTATE